MCVYENKCLYRMWLTMRKRERERERERERDSERDKRQADREVDGEHKNKIINFKYVNLKLVIIIGGW